MKKLLVLAVACLIASPAFAADLKWYGEAGYRYDQGKIDDSLARENNVREARDVSQQTVKEHQVRARLGVTGGKDHVDYGIGFKTTTAGVVNTDYVYFNNNQDRNIGLDMAYFRYANDWGFGDLSVTVGRSENVFAYDKMNQFLFDNDVSWDGFGWKWKMGNFGINAAQYILGGNTAGTVGNSMIIRDAENDANPSNHQKFATMLGVQPNFSFRFTDEIEAMFAVGYYVWNGEDSSTNTVHGHQTMSFINTGLLSTGAAVTDDNQTFKVGNPHQWQFLVDTTLPMNFGFGFEYIMNKKASYNALGAVAGDANHAMADVKRSAWAGTLSYGKIARAHDWKVAYSYGKRGLASGIDAYSNDRFLADEKGHTVAASYALSDSLSLGAKYMSLKEVSNLDANGNTPGNAVTSANATGRSHKWKYWELTAGVAF